MFGEENVTGVSALHHPVRDVQSGAGEIGAIGYIDDATGRPAVDAHTDLQRRMIFERATNLYGAANRRFRTGVENQRHAVATSDFDQTISRIGFLKLLSRANNPRQFIHGRLLLVNGKFRIPNDVDKQNMPYL